MAFLTRRKSRSGVYGNYYIVYFDESKSRQSISTGTKLKTEANKKLQEFQNNQKAKISDRILATDFKDKYLEYKKNIATEKTWKSIKTSFNELIRVLGDKYLQNYTTRDMDEFMTTKINEASVYTARKYRIHLRAALNQAVRWNYLAGNPFTGTQKFNLPLKDVIPFTKEDFNKLMSVIDDELFIDLTKFSLFTGMRLGEITNLKINDISFENKTILVRSNEEHRTKSGKSRFIELADELEPIIIKRAELTEDYLFKGTRRKIKIQPNYVTRKFKKYVRKANLNEAYTFHTLRKTFGCWLLEKDVPIKKISLYLGHSSVSITEKYYATFIKNKFAGEVNMITDYLNS